MSHIKFFVFMMIACALYIAPTVGVTDVAYMDTDTDTDGDSDTDSDADTDSEGDTGEEDTDDSSDDDTDNDDDDSGDDDKSGGDDSSCSFTQANQQTSFQFLAIAGMLGLGVWLLRRKK
ncbi:MAG: hypothetical protein JXX14_01600 [Deltaproteobacteria bacterium]|nr:hypothetical protein [Deltaproteobacteria bacterium]